MKIIAWQKTSFIDYPGKASTIIFTPECNYQCPSCHAKHLLGQREYIIDEEYIFNYLDSRRKWIEGVVISGGEPTLQPDLLDFIVRLKDRGLDVKLDTNGSSPHVLKSLLKLKTIDYVAMDVKGPKNLYPKIVGKGNVNIKKIEESMRIVQKFPGSELRTTVIPIYENEKFRWMTPEEIRDITEWICNCTKDDKPKYYLQKFVSRSGKEMINKNFSKEKLPENMWETPKEILIEGLKEARKYISDAEIRG